MPLPSGARACLYLPAAAESGSVTIHNVAGERVMAMALDSATPCWSLPLAPGIYIARFSIRYQDGRNHTEEQKIAVVPR
jgi:hypothetical protein